MHPRLFVYYIGNFLKQPHDRKLLLKVARSAVSPVASHKCVLVLSSDRGVTWRPRLDSHYQQCEAQYRCVVLSQNTALTEGLTSLCNCAESEKPLPWPRFS